MKTPKLLLTALFVVSAVNCYLYAQSGGKPFGKLGLASITLKHMSYQVDDLRVYCTEDYEAVSKLFREGNAYLDIDHGRSLQIGEDKYVVSQSIPCREPVKVGELFKKLNLTGMVGKRQWRVFKRNAIFQTPMRREMTPEEQSAFDSIVLEPGDIVHTGVLYN